MLKVSFNPFSSALTAAVVAGVVAAGLPAVEPLALPAESVVLAQSSASSVTVIDGSTPGYYNAALGTSLDGTQQQFPCGDLVCGDPNVSGLAEPDLSSVSSVLGSWLSGSVVPLANWSGPAAIPSAWTRNTETALVYELDAGVDGLADVVASIGVDNGVFVWFDGHYMFGAMAPGTAVPGEYQVELGDIDPGVHWLQILREDHGASTDWNIQVTAFEDSVGSDANLGAGNESFVHNPHCMKADPVNCATGNFWRTFSDMAVPGRGPALSVSRTYNSVAADVDGLFGFGWSSWLQMRLSEDTAAGVVTVVQESGSRIRFVADGSGGWQPQADHVMASLQQDGSGWLLTRHRTDRFRFDASGRLLWAEDRNGYRTSLGYDAAGDLATVTDHGGRQLDVDVDTAGRIVKVTDPVLRTVDYVYDTAGDLVEVIDVAGESWRFSYTTGHLLTHVTDPVGGTVTNVFDTNNRVVTQTDAEGGVWNWSFPPAKTVITDPNGNVEVHTYRRGALTSVTKGYGTAEAATWTYERDPFTLGITKTTDPNGHVTTATYDTFGNLLSTTNPDGKTATATYGPLGELTSFTDESGVTSTFVYDGQRNLTSASRPLVETGQTATTSYEYSAIHPGDLVAVTGPEGGVTSMAYGSNGDLVRVTDPTGSITRMNHDSIGRLIGLVAPNADLDGQTQAAWTTSFEHNARGQVTKTTDPGGAVTTASFDAKGRLSSSTDADGNTTSYLYDRNDRPVRVVRADSSELETVYDPAGNVISQLDGAGRSTAYGYDTHNRVASVTDPLGRATTIGYDGVGNRTTVTHPDGQVTSYGYDRLDRLTRVAYSDGVTPNITYSYDVLGRRTSMTDGTGTSSYRYDSLGRLTSHTNGAGDTVDYRHDLAGRVTELTWPDGGTVRTYDAAGRLLTVAHWLFPATTGSLGLDAGGGSVEFTYDLNSNLVGQSGSNGVESIFVYDRNDRVASIRHLLDPNDQSLGIEALGWDYTRTAAGLVSSETPAPTAAVSPSSSYGYNDLNQLDSYNGGSYGYDPADNLVRLADGTTIGYDVANQPTTATLHAGADMVEFDYDVRGRRVGQSGPAAEEREYAYDQESRLTELRETFVDPGALLDAGVAHSVAVDRHGNVYTWGEGDNGRLGNGATTDVDVPTSIELPRTVGVAAGARHTLAVVASGVVYAWGAGADGQLATVGQSDHTAPIRVIGPTGINQAAAGSEHSLALTGQGTVWAWGKASLPGHDLSGYDDGQPLLVANLTDIIQITAGGIDGQTGHSVALKSDGTVHAWGPNTHGQLGDGTTSESSVPTEVAGVSGIVQVATGGDTTYALSSTGRVWMWGDNRAGQAGGATTATSVPTPTAVPGLTGIVAIDASAGHAVAVGADGTVYSWGANDDGQTGQTSCAPGDRTTTPTAVAGATGAAAVAAGGGHSLVAKTAGDVYAFGADGSGQLGNSTSPATCAPVAIGLADVAALPGLVAGFGYDGDGLRATEISPDDGNLIDVGSPRSFIWDLSGPIPLLLSDGTNDYWYGPDRRPVMQTTLAGNFEWHHLDQLGSVRALSDSAGAATAVYDYDPYGNITYALETGIDDADEPTGSITVDDGRYPGGMSGLRYAGEWLDRHTGLYYLRARYYDPAYGQFLTRDPLVAMTRQPYLYANGTPTAYTDPLGLWWGSDLYHDFLRGSVVFYDHRVGLLKAGSVVAGVLAIPATGGTSLALAAGSLGLSTSAEVLDNKPCKAERVTRTLALGGAGLTVGTLWAGAGEAAGVANDLASADVAGRIGTVFGGGDLLTNLVPSPECGC